MLWVFDFKPVLFPPEIEGQISDQLSTEPDLNGCVLQNRITETSRVHELEPRIYLFRPNSSTQAGTAYNMLYCITNNLLCYITSLLHLLREVVIEYPRPSQVVALTAYAETLWAALAAYTPIIEKNAR